MTALAILSPGFPSTPGGVTDHTHRLARRWSGTGHQVRVIGDVVAAPEALASELAASHTTALLIQYVPFLYARRGVSRVPERVARAARALGIRVTVFVHEPWVPMTRLPWLVLGPLQRRQLHRLTQVADHVATAVPAWASSLGRHVELVYVGSNLGPVPADLPTAPLTGPVVFSPTAAGLRFDWVAAAARAIAASPALVLVGVDGRDAQRHPQLSKEFDPAWDWRGRLPAPDALRVMARARLVMAPFIDGATGRRTSMIAALSSGTRVLSSTGPLLDPLFRNSPVLLANTEAEFVDLAVRIWKEPDPPGAREARLAWHRRHLDPADLDARLLQTMTGPP